MKGYLKERGFGGTLVSDVKGFFQFGHKTKFMYKVKRAIIALSKKTCKIKKVQEN